MEKTVAILGSTGVVGQRALKIARGLGLKVVALAAKSSIRLLHAQAEGAATFLYDKSGLQGLQEAAQMADITLIAIPGSVGLIPTISAIQAGKTVLIANKEILAFAGELLMKLAKQHGAKLIPVDSEQSAIFQCLQMEKKVKRIILTASGGPFLDGPIVEKRAVLHPHFAMGPKLAVNSSTLMNKGLEMMGARWLFDVAPEKIETVIHPEQKMQSCVELVDGAVLALLAEPDMDLPIHYAFTYPERKERNVCYDFMGQLTFLPPDEEKFLCLKLAKQAMRAGKSYPCFLHAANEVLVEQFLQGKVRWIEIGQRLEKIISSHIPQDLLTLEQILEVDYVARQKALL